MKADDTIIITMFTISIWLVIILHTGQPRHVGRIITLATVGLANNNGYDIDYWFTIELSPR